MTGFITERDKVTGADIAKMNEIAGMIGAGEYRIASNAEFSNTASPDEKEKEKDE